MSRIAYVNGRYVPHRDALIHVEDRGYQFADGVYEVIAVRDGRLVDEELHLDRLGRSLKELRIAWPVSRRVAALAMREMIRRNRLRNGIIYLQMTRGVARRDHPFPKGVRGSFVMTARAIPLPDEEKARKGVRVITVPDIRWARRDIKSVALLPNVLGKQQAREAGAYEAWQVDADGRVTEGTSTNAWIVTPGGELVTRRADSAILNGVTRLALIDIARRAGLTFVERPFSVEEAKAAREAFLTSTMSYVLPVVRIDDTMIGDGKAGPISLRLRQAYMAHMLGEES